MKCIVINGMGWIGCMVFKFLIDYFELELVVVNDIVLIDNIVYLI